MLNTAIDNLIGIVSPRWAARRTQWRSVHKQLKASATDHEAMRKMLAGRNAGGYDAGKNNRLTYRIEGSAHENDLPREQIKTMRWRSWNLFRNNPQARKIIRSLQAKVIGRGLSPQPQTLLPDETPHVEFRRRARQIWAEFAAEADFRGKPGRGGQHLTSLNKTALKSIVLSGSVMLRFQPLDRATQGKKQLLLPLQIQLVHSDRLDERVHDGNRKFYGVELDASGRPVAYHILKGDETEDSTKVPAAEIVHLFAEEDIDQLLGTPWLGAALLTMDDRRSYEGSELTAAEMSACVVAGYRRSGGQTQLGLANSDADYDLTDTDGNAITSLQPGMFMDLGESGELQMISSNRPNSSAEGFLAHLIRSEAVGMPGVKTSTLTGDYRNSSFSSERSADNDAWPELEDLQDWFASGFCQPIYEQVIITAATAGLFDGIEGFTLADFNTRRRDYLITNWQGPVARSINPKDDAKAATNRVQNANSSPQREAAQIGRDWREILQEIQEFIAYAQDLGVPDDVWQQALGIVQIDAQTSKEAAPDEEQTEQQQDDATTFESTRLTGFAFEEQTEQQQDDATAAKLKLA